MLYRREQAWPHGACIEIRFICPCCGYEGEYYTWAPEVCNNCGFHIEELLLMDHREDHENIIKYYLEGEL